jgi:hypothetical protein
MSNADTQVNKAAELFVYRKRTVFSELEIKSVPFEKKPAALSSRLRKHRFGHY